MFIKKIILTISVYKDKSHYCSVACIIYIIMYNRYLPNTIQEPISILCTKKKIQDPTSIQF